AGITDASGSRLVFRWLAVSVIAVEGFAGTDLFLAVVTRHSRLAQARVPVVLLYTIPNGSFVADSRTALGLLGHEGALTHPDVLLVATLFKPVS
ncbi:hypothetical protein PMAYCL1PPCAC_30807, partial [Pristionchus mayeri]